MAGEYARRAAYERLYAEYRDAVRAYEAARARGAYKIELLAATCRRCTAGAGRLPSITC